MVSLFGGPRCLQVSLSLGNQGAHKSQALWWTKALAQFASPLGEQGAYKSYALWGTKGFTSRKIHITARVHHWCPTANSHNRKGAPLVSHREFTKLQGCTIVVPPRHQRTPRVYHWGSTANSQNPNGAPLRFHPEFTNPKGVPLGSHREFEKPPGCTIGVPPRIHKRQWCTIGVPQRIHKTPRVHNWGPTAN